MTRSRWLIAAGSAVVVLAVVGLALWRWGPLAEQRPDVAGCPELAKTLPRAAGGSWAVSKPDSAQRIAKSSTLCELAFTSADQRFSGTVSVFVTGNTDTEVLRREVRDGRCNDDIAPLDADRGYLALKTCEETIGDVFRASVLAAKKPRWVNMVVTIPIRAETRTDVPGFARDLARTVADQGLTIPASD